MGKLDEKGITLVELLAALLLVSIIATAAWTALSIGMKHTTTETSKTEIQQDANSMISQLSAAHRQSDSYKIQFQNDQLLLQTCSETACGDFEPVLDKAYDFSGTVINGISAPNESALIEPKKEHTNIQLELTRNGRSLSIQTTLTRIRTDRP